MSMAMDIPRKYENKHGGAAARIRVRQAGGGRAALEAAMLAAGEPLHASTKRMVAERMAQSQPRYRIGDGQGRFLSRDGRLVVTCSREAWFGDADQAGAALRFFAAARGMRPLRVIAHKLPHLSTQLVL